MKQWQKIDEQWIIKESFLRLPAKVVGNDVYSAQKLMDSIATRQFHGDDFQDNDIDMLIKLLEKIQKSAKKFEKGDDVPDEYMYKK